jgi:hydroxymethylglutaryl-CoA lyase
LGDKVKIIECPRDAWQGLPALLPAEIKAGYLQQLIRAGFRHIDAVSFVSPVAVPQMSDSEEVLQLLEAPGDVEIIGIVANIRGAERAIRTGAVGTIGFPYSISARFLERNQRQTPDESLRMVRAIRGMATDAGLQFVAYVSMAFGNPYGDLWDARLVKDACNQLVDAGVTTISLSDTVGLANAEVITETVGEVFAVYDGVEIGVHLHARPSDSVAKIRAAYQAGCRRFDAAMGGLGGCPFAQDELVGNVATEVLIHALRDLGAELPALQDLQRVAQANQGIARTFGLVAP